MKKVLIASTLILWPINLFFSLRSESTTHLFGIIIVTTIFVLLTQAKKSFASLPLLLLPIFSEKLFIIPLIYFFIEILKNKNSITPLLLLIVCIPVSLFSFQSYFNQSIFTFDYQAQQLIERETKLYPNTVMARLFHNKVRIKSDKFVSNFLALTDPNNYFFGFHPRQIVRDNLNVKKFPIASIPFIILFFLRRAKMTIEEKRILLLTVLSLLTLSTLNNFDRIDIILFAPLSFFIVKSIQENFIDRKRILAFLLTVFCLWEVIYSLTSFL